MSKYNLYLTTRLTPVSMQLSKEIAVAFTSAEFSTDDKDEIAVLDTLANQPGTGIKTDPARLKVDYLTPRHARRGVKAVTPNARRGTQAASTPATVTAEAPKLAESTTTTTAAVPNTATLKSGTQPDTSGVSVSEAEEILKASPAVKPEVKVPNRA